MTTSWRASRSKPFRIQCLPYMVRIASAVRIDTSYSQHRTRWVVEIFGREYGLINRVLLERRPTEDSVLRVSWTPKVDGVTGGRKRAAVGTTVLLYNDGCIPTVNPEAWDAYSRRLSELARWPWADIDHDYRAVGILLYNHASNVPDLPQEPGR